MSGLTRRKILQVSGAALGGIAFGTTVTAAESTDRFIVDAKGKGKRVRDRDDLSVVFDLDAVDALVVEGPESAVERTGAKYAPDVAYDVEPSAGKVDLEDASVADEPYYGYQWDKQAQNVGAAHETTKGDGTRVAVIDSGVTASHPDLRHAVNEDLGRNFTNDRFGANGPYGGYHGTHVAGIVAANDSNERGVVGTAPETELVDCRVFSDFAEDSGSFASVLAAMLYAAEIDADVANLSLGAYPVSRRGLGSFYGKLMNRTTTHVTREGTLLVVASGNDGADLQHDGNYLQHDGDPETKGSVVNVPAENAGVMCVSATGPVGFRHGDAGLEDGFRSPAFYTNYGTNAVDVSAPGGNYAPDAVGTGGPWYFDLVLNAVGEYTAFERDDDGNPVAPVEDSLTYSYSWVAGTSMAAPQVAGAAALVRAANPNMNANQARKAVRNAAVDTDAGREYEGAGFLDPVGALED